MFNFLDKFKKKKYYAERIDIPQFSKEAWLALYPNGGEDWKDTPFSQGASITITEMLNAVSKECKITKNTIIRNIPIDKRFIDWLDEKRMITKNKEEFDTTDYFASKTEEEMEELSKTCYYMEDFFTMAICVGVLFPEDLGPNSFFRVGEPISKQLEEYLEKIYGKNNIRIPGCILKVDDAYDVVDEFCNDTLTYFGRGSESISYFKYIQQHYEEDEVLSPVFFVIPIGVRRKIEKSVQTIEEFSDELYGVLYPSFGR